MVSGRGYLKGYLYGFNGQQVNVEAMLWSRIVKESREETGSVVEHLSSVRIYYDRPSIDELENDFLLIMNDATQDMEVLFGNPYWQKMINRSPFSRSFPNENLSWKFMQVNLHHSS